MQTKKEKKISASFLISLPLLKLLSYPPKLYVAILSDSFSRSRAGKSEEAEEEGKGCLFVLAIVHADQSIKGV